MFICCVHCCCLFSSLKDKEKLWTSVYLFYVKCSAWVTKTEKTKTYLFTNLLSLLSILFFYLSDCVLRLLWKKKNASNRTLNSHQNHLLQSLSFESSKMFLLLLNVSCITWFYGWSGPETEWWILAELRILREASLPARKKKNSLRSNLLASLSLLFIFIPMERELSSLLVDFCHHCAANKGRTSRRTAPFCKLDPFAD